MAEEMESRMEQIRLKNEELEKKHKEILEDELEAKKIGAVVETKQNSSTKEASHPYDHVDLDFDVKDEHRELAGMKNPDYKPKNRRPILGKKQLDEIPPDPVNFLRENSEESKDEGAANNNKRPQNNNNSNNNNNNNNNRNRRRHGPDGFQNNSNDSGHQRQPRNNNNFNRNNSNNESSSSDAAQSSPRKPHPQQLRSERRTAPFADQQQQQQPQQQHHHKGEPNKPYSAQGQNNRPRRPNNNGNSNNGSNRAPNNQQSRPNRENNGERSNITVQVNDEVRSVKLKTSEKIGTGRVRPPTDGNYDVSIDNDTNTANERNKSNEGKRNSGNKNPRNRPYKNHNKPKTEPEFQHPILEKIVISKTSVQERLNRSKLLDEKDLGEPKIVSEPSTTTDEN